LGLGGNCSTNGDFLNSNVDFLLNFDDFESVGNHNGSFKVYLGHHGDTGSFTSNLILPTTAFIEKTSTYANVLGMVQKTKKALFSPGNSRDD
jgi:NADH-quinone oxidoreductase subunit G